MKTILSTDLAAMANIDHKKILKAIDYNKDLFRGRYFNLPYNQAVGRPKRIHKLDSVCVSLLLILIDNDLDKTCITDALVNCDIIDTIGVQYADSVN